MSDDIIPELLKIHKDAYSNRLIAPVMNTIVVCILGYLMVSYTWISFVFYLFFVFVLIGMVGLGIFLYNLINVFKYNESTSNIKYDQFIILFRGLNRGNLLVFSMRLLATIEVTFLLSTGFIFIPVTIGIFAILRELYFSYANSVILND